MPPPDVATEATIPGVGWQPWFGGRSTRHAAHLGVDGPVDDGTILGLDFHNQELGLPCRLHPLVALRATCVDVRVPRAGPAAAPAHRAPPRWLVKAPYHNFHLDDLAAQYPTRAS